MRGGNAVATSLRLDGRTAVVSTTEAKWHSIRPLGRRRSAVERENALFTVPILRAAQHRESHVPAHFQFLPALRERKQAPVSLPGLRIENRSSRPSVAVLFHVPKYSQANHRFALLLTWAVIAARIRVVRGSRVQ